MLSHNLLGYGTQLVLATGFALGIYALLRPSVRALLDELLKLPAGTAFYLRSLLLILLMTALGHVIGDKFDYKAETAFMEYVWDVAQSVGEVLKNSVWLFVVYLVQITVLTAVLRRKHEQ